MPKEKPVVSKIFYAVVFILLEIAAISMLSHNNELQRLWLTRISHGFMAKTWGTTQAVGNYFSLMKQNDELSLENERLRGIVRGYRQAPPSHSMPGRKAFADTLYPGSGSCGAPPFLWCT